MQAAEPPPEPPVLWHLAVSHYSEKVRWALELKGIEHVRQGATPGLQRRTARRLGAGRTLPILELDGQAIGDSTRIIEALEERWPEPPLYPADPKERARALELEELFDEACGPDVRRVIFADSLTEPGKFMALFAGPEPRRGPVRVLSPAIHAIVKRRFDLRPERVEESRRKVRAALDTIERNAGADGYLVGDSFSVADLTAASLLAVLVVPPELSYVRLPVDQRSAAARRFRDSLADHPGFRWVETMYARHRRAGASAAAPHSPHA